MINYRDSLRSHWEHVKGPKAWTVDPYADDDEEYSWEDEPDDVHKIGATLSLTQGTNDATPSHTSDSDNSSL